MGRVRTDAEHPFHIIRRARKTEDYNADSEVCLFLKEGGVGDVLTYEGYDEEDAED